MGEIELDNETRLQLYKHYWTRRYLHLDGEGNAWFYREDGRYEQLVDDLVRHFNRVVLWHYPGQHGESPKSGSAATKKGCPTRKRAQASPPAK